jgi:hypothetical protein
LEGSRNGWINRLKQRLFWRVPGTAGLIGFKQRLFWKVQGTAGLIGSSNGCFGRFKERLV